MARQTLRVIPLGGLGEIGKNMMAFELADDIVVIDCGLQFPEQEMLGVDLVIPDISYLLERADKVRAILLTHGHEDHIGALPYVLRDLNVPVYCTRLTFGLVSVKLKEHRLLRESDLRVIEPGTMIELGGFTAEFFRVAHSIPDACGIVLHTPFGRVIHTGDFKLDHTPVMGQHTDLPRLSELGSEGVTLLCADSTYAEVPGYTPSEQVVGEALDNIMNQAAGRVIVATFASLISRIQQVIDAAIKHNRRVFIVGRSMVDNVNMALEQGYLEAPNGVLGRIEELGRLPAERVAIVTTGSQGEPTSALARMSQQEHRWVDIIPGDTVVLSASPIPGNEQYVYQVVDNLFKLGAHVLYNRVDNIHVRGHAAQEELKLILSLVRPKYLLPVHGEYRHLTLHARLGQAMGMRPEETFVLEDGDVLEIDMDGAQVAGRVPATAVYVDGLGVGDVDHVVLRDRRHLANDGMVVVVIAVDKQSGKVIDLPDVLSRGFVDADEAAWLMDKARELARQSLDGADHRAEWPAINARVKDTVAKFLYDETRRRPMVLPVAVEV
ncbi:MAG TPA: ribonuclease J [Dehalococcoidia bacterium]|nr:ribonuclease J [Dehalococcoidia bacterium]